MKKLFLLLVFSALVFAQGNTGLMNGQITDPAGAAVPGAQVAVTNVDTKAVVRTTTNSYRSTYINGMPLESINVTIDGINTNDNWLKSQDGFFSYIMPSVDSLEEVTLSTSAGGVDSTAQGGAQLKFTTKSGTNEYHGGVFWQHRNTFFNSNYYF